MIYVKGILEPTVLKYQEFGRPLMFLDMKMPPHKKRRIENPKIPQTSPINADSSSVIGENNSSQASDVSSESGRITNVNTGQRTIIGHKSSSRHTRITSEWRFAFEYDAIAN